MVGTGLTGRVVITLPQKLFLTSTVESKRLAAFAKITSDQELLFSNPKDSKQTDMACLCDHLVRPLSRSSLSKKTSFNSLLALCATFL